MVERFAVNEDVAGSSPASPASDLDCQRIVDAIVDYNFAEVRKKMELHGVDFDLALEMQKAVIIARARAE